MKLSRKRRQMTGIPLKPPFWGSGGPRGPPGGPAGGPKFPPPGAPGIFRAPPGASPRKPPKPAFSRTNTMGIGGYTQTPKMAQKKGQVLSRVGELLNTLRKVHPRGPPRPPRDPPGGQERPNVKESVFISPWVIPQKRVSPGDPVGLPNAIVISDRIPKHSPCRMGVNIISPV